MQIKKISLSRLWKIEMPGIIGKTIYVLKKYDVEKLHLGFWLSILEKNKLQIDTLTIQKSANRYTVFVDKWHNQSLDYAASITMQMRGIAKANLKSLRQEIIITQEVVDIFLADLRNHNRVEIKGLINDFLGTIKDSPEVKEAFTKIGLMPYIDELRIADQTHNKYYIKRRLSEIKIQRRDTNKAIKKEGEQALRSFFEQVEVANRTYPELNYAPLIAELNSVIVEYTNLIKTRATYNKKRALKAKQKKNAALAKQTNTEMQLMCVDKKPTGVMIVGKKG